MNFRRESVDEYYLRDTHVENIFINEYMTSAPGDFVKVYLFALMYAGYKIPMDNQTVAKQLSMEVEDVLKAWSYWESMGVVKKYFDNSDDKFNYKIEFLNLKEKIYCGQKKKKKSTKAHEPKNPLEDTDIKNMFTQIEKITGRILGGKDPIEIISWIEDYEATPEVILQAYDHSMKIKKTSGCKYVGAIVKEWTKKGFHTKIDVEKYLGDTDNRHYLYKRVLKSLGFMRNATEAEKTIMDTWFDDLGLSIDRVLEACGKTSGISNPNINYVNSVLKAWEKGSEKKGGGGIGNDGKPNYIAMVLKSYEESRANYERQSEERRQEVYKAIPRIKEIDEEARTLTMEMSKLMLSGGVGKNSKIEALKKKVTSINTEKAFLLTENNFNLDYMDIMYSCSLCNDTGTQDTGDRCACFAERLAELQKMG